MGETTTADRFRSLPLTSHPKVSLVASLMLWTRVHNCYSCTEQCII